MDNNENYKISLISPPSRARSPRPPLGLMYIAANIRKYIPDVQVNIIDIKSSEEYEQIYEKILKEVREDKPNLVGITCMSSDVADVKHLAERIKYIDENIIIVVGGIHSTLFPNFFFESSTAINIAVKGEGEETMVEIINAIRNRKSLSSITGIAYKDNSEIKNNPDRPPIADIDSLPFPAFDLVNMDFYTKPNEWVIRGVPISGFWIFTSRGCPYRCKFCVNKNLSGHGVRLRSAEKIVDELEFLVNNFQIDGFFIYDDSFGLNKKRVFETCNEIIKRKLNLIWGCQSRVNILTEEMVKKMRQAGCIQLEFGVESGSQDILNQLNKQITVEEVRRAFKLCDQYNLRKLANFLINVPGETIADVEASINLADDIRANVNLFNVTTLFPGSDLYYDFTSKIPEEDMVKFATQDDFAGLLKLIEEKYKLSSHNIPITDILKTIATRIPLRGRLALRLDKQYLTHLYDLVSFLFNKRYIHIIMKSKKKWQYFKLLFSLLQHQCRK